MNKRNLLIVLGIIWIIILIYNFGLFGAGTGGGEPGSKLLRAAQVADAKDFPTLNTARLQKKQTAFNKVGKDIFSPYSGVARKGSDTVVPLAAPLAVTAGDPLDQLVAELSFIGFMENAREKTIFLGMGDDLLLVKKGISIKGLLRVQAITDKKMTLVGLGGESHRSFEVSLE